MTQNIFEFSTVGKPGELNRRPYSMLLTTDFSTKAVLKKIIKFLKVHCWEYAYFIRQFMQIWKLWLENFTVENYMIQLLLISQ